MSLQNNSYNSLITHLRFTHNIQVSTEDLEALTLFYNETSEIWERRLANEPNAVYYEINNGRVLTVVAFAVVGFFLAPILGIGALAGALIGASIGWRLVGGFSNKTSVTNKTDPKTPQLFGFNTAPVVTTIGGVIPLVFTNKLINPAGGVRTSGVVLHSRVETWGGVQKLYALYGLCLGDVGEINESSLLINNQPRSTFFTDEIVTVTRTGYTSQNNIVQYLAYSQCISVSTNNQLGISKRGKHIGTATTSSTIYVSADTFDSFSPTDQYVIDGGREFLITSKNQANNTLQINTQSYLAANADIFALYKVKYQTSKACTEIQLNLVANLWGRDSNNNLLQHGLLFGVYIDSVFIARFLISNKTESDMRRRIIIRNLPFTKHVVELIPINGTSDGNNVYRIIDNQQKTTINTNIFIANKNIQIEFENTPGTTISVNDINTIINLNKAQSSSDKGAVCQLTTVNEIVYASDLGHPRISNYQNIALGALVVTASNRLQSDPAPSWEISQGIRGRLHISAGFANSSSNNNQLNDISANFINDGVQTGFTIRNLDLGNETSILSFSQNSILTREPMYWRQGDRYLVYQNNVPLCYFPDIYVWTLTRREGGLGGLLTGSQLPDFFIDYESIVRSRKFCVNNNFFWDGVVDASIAWSQWASQESMGSLLFPTRIGGKFGLIPETTTTPVALFNASNILPDTYAEDYAQQQRLNCVHITYTDNSNIIPRDYTVSVMTTAAANGTESLFTESIKLSAITNKNQAIRVGQVYLKSRLLQDRVIQFGTGLQGYGLREGDLIIVQHLTTEIDKECSGFVLETQPFSNGSQKIILSAPSPIGIDNNNYSAAVYRLETSQIQQNLTCSGVVEGNPPQTYLQINGLTSPLLPSRENYTGDYVVLGKDTTHRRTYRVQKIEPQDNGSVNITAILWVPEILGTNGLVVVD